MAKSPKKDERQKEEKEIPQMPFDDALRRILGAPPQHKVTKKQPSKK
jgi:hypothetical protein